MPSEGERFYPPSHGNETQPRADGGGVRKKGLPDEKKNERIYIKEREKGAERMEFEWRPDRANK